MELWKLKREAVRFRQQVMCLPEFFTEPAKNKNHNARFQAGLKTHDGEVAFCDRLAIYLIFQPNGISDGILDTCAHLVSKGYAPFVVSNAELSPDDIDKIKGSTWKTIERPNFGHDFGGYRDAMLSLFNWNIVPEYLCILNDSIWFPVYDDENLIEWSEGQGEAIAGTILRESASERFLESYFYLIPKSVFRLDEFRAFWNSYNLTSNKYKVIRRGERGFSKAMIDAGVDLKPMYPTMDFWKALETKDDEFLRQTLRYGTFPDSFLERRREELLVSTHETWRSDTLSFIRSTMAKRMHYSAFPYAMTKITDYPILKKSNDHVATNWREAIVRAWRAGDLPHPREVVISEAEARLKAQAKGEN